MSNDRWFDDQYRKLPEDMPPSEVDDLILSAAEQASQPQSNNYPARRYGLWATAAVVVLSVSVFINDPDQTLLYAPASSIEEPAAVELNEQTELRVEKVDQVFDDKDTTPDRETKAVVPSPLDANQPAASPLPSAGLTSPAGLPAPAARTEEIIITGAFSESTEAEVDTLKQTKRRTSGRKIQEVVVTAERRNSSSQKPVAHIERLLSESLCHQFETATGPIYACDVADALVLSSGDCEEVLKIPLGTLTMDENKQLQHEHVGRILCDDSKWQMGD